MPSPTCLQRMVLLILPHMAREKIVEIVPLDGGFWGNRSTSHQTTAEKKKDDQKKARRRARKAKAAAQAAPAAT